MSYIHFSFTSSVNSCGPKRNRRGLVECQGRMRTITHKPFGEQNEFVIGFRDNINNSIPCNINVW